MQLHQQRSRHTNPMTHAAMDAAMAEAKARFEPHLSKVAAEIKALFAKAKKHGVTSADEVQGSGD
jgi:phage host-nuclease inhibitor protein Gam